MKKSTLFIAVFMLIGSVGVSYGMKKLLPASVASTLKASNNLEESSEGEKKELEGNEGIVASIDGDAIPFMKAANKVFENMSPEEKQEADQRAKENMERMQKKFNENRSSCIIL